MISLKAYNLEIEKMIDQGQYDEAIAHGKYILFKFPKYIETYRNIGKSLLELNRYPEAMDIFTRILSVFPDDFVSHVGLSVISEEQKNLDLSIWHMELAFDVQPSNVAIQDELRRLFKLRDGDFPTKIRLTRGALVRMYARGDLFQQAISEIQSILIEDPKRIDLEVILAKMLFLSGSIDESVKICNKILNIIPYCFEANQILEKVCIQNNDKEKAAVFRNRIISLDPYYEFVSSPFADYNIPENKILLEKTTLSPNSLSNQNFGQVWSDYSSFPSIEQSDENIDWLQDLNNNNNENMSQPKDQYSKKRSDTPPPAINDEIPGSNSKDNWTTSFDTDHLELNQEAHYSFENDRPIFTHDVDHGISESDSLRVLRTENFTQNDELYKSDSISRVASEDLATFFSGLSEGIMDTENKDSANNEEAVPQSNWMSQFSNSEEPNNNKSNSTDLPDWLNSVENHESINQLENSDMPNWLKDLQSEVEPDSLLVPEKKAEVTESSIASSDENDGWEKNVIAETLSEENSESQKTVATNDKSAIDDNKIPDWVNSVLISEDTNQVMPLKEETKNDPLENEVSIFSSSIQDELNDSSPAASGIISQQTNDELLDWLRGLKSEDERNESIGQSGNKEDTLTEALESTSSIDKEKLQVKNIQTEEELNEITANILSNQLLPNQRNYTLPNDEEISTTIPLEEELSSLFNQTVEMSSKNINNNLNSSESPLSSDDSSALFERQKVPTDMNKLSSDLKSLLEQKQFSILTSSIFGYIEEGVSIDQLLEIIKPNNDELFIDFSYWQFLGDVLAKMNKLSDAISAYQKAEEILMKKITA